MRERRLLNARNCTLCCIGGHTATCSDALLSVHHTSLSRTELPDTKRTASVRCVWPERGRSEARGWKSKGRGRNWKFEFSFVCIGTIAPVLFAADDEGRMLQLVHISMLQGDGTQLHYRSEVACHSLSHTFSHTVTLVGNAGYFLLLLWVHSRVDLATSCATAPRWLRQPRGILLVTNTRTHSPYT